MQRTLQQFHNLYANLVAPLHKDVLHLRCYFVHGNEKLDLRRLVRQLEQSRKMITSTEDYCYMCMIEAFVASVRSYY